MCCCREWIQLVADLIMGRLRSGRHMGSIPERQRLRQKAFTRTGYAGKPGGNENIASNDAAHLSKEVSQLFM